MNIPGLPWVAYTGDMPQPEILAIASDRPADPEYPMREIRRWIGYRLYDDDVVVRQVCRCLGDWLRRHTPKDGWPKIPDFDLALDRNVLVCGYHVNWEKLTR